MSNQEGLTCDLCHVDFPSDKNLIYIDAPHIGKFYFCKKCVKKASKDLDVERYVGDVEPVTEISRSVPVSSRIIFTCDRCLKVTPEKNIAKVRFTIGDYSHDGHFCEECQADIIGTIKHPSVKFVPPADLAGRKTLV